MAVFSGMAIIVRILRNITTPNAIRAGAAQSACMVPKRPTIEKENPLNAARKAIIKHTVNIIEFLNKRRKIPAAIEMSKIEILIAIRILSISFFYQIMEKY